MWVADAARLLRIAARRLQVAAHLLLQVVDAARGVAQLLVLRVAQLLLVRVARLLLLRIAAGLGKLLVHLVVRRTRGQKLLALLKLRAQPALLD